MNIARWWEKSDNQSVICNLCPRKCQIKNGKIGFCNVRKNVNGQLVSLAYGFPSAINIDPIEKKPMFHFYPGSQIFSVGTLGCNLDCKFCQNYEISRNNYDRFKPDYIAPEEIVNLAIKKGCKSIAFTYNEPTVFGEYVLNIAKFAKDKNLNTVMVTNGYINDEPLRDIYQYIDAANVDLKAITDNFYLELCKGNLNPVLNSLNIMKEMGVFIEITNLLIPGYNDDFQMIKSLVDWILKNLGADIPLHFSAFFPTYKLANINRTPAEVINMAEDLALKRGMKYVYKGNVMSNEGENTYCPNCNKLLVRRDGYTITEINLFDATCECGEKINIKQ